jgi:hypothetical protein
MPGAKTGRTVPLQAESRTVVASSCFLEWQRNAAFVRKEARRCDGLVSPADDRLSRRRVAARRRRGGCAPQPRPLPKGGKKGGHLLAFARRDVTSRCAGNEDG